MTHCRSNPRLIIPAREETDIIRVAVAGAASERTGDRIIGEIF